MKRSLHIVALAVLALLLIGPIPKSLAGPPAPRPKAPADTPIKALASGTDAAAYGTGTVVHADALRSGKNALVDLDVAFSGSAFSTAPVEGVTNEVHRAVNPHLDANAGFGRGTGLELGLGSDPVPLIGQLSAAYAPPSTKLIEHVIGPLGVPGVLTADLLRSQAQSRSAANACVLGPDQAYGLGSVLNLNVLNGLLNTVASPPLREISQSASTTRIVPGSTPGRLGLRSETRQTIAPVTLFKGTPEQFTIEVLGEWALRATADGAKGSVSYGPLSASPETPVLRVLGDHGQVLGQLTTQQLLGPKGLEVTIPGVAEIVLGEDPRMIGGNASSSPQLDPTLTAAAVDVVRVKLLGGALADVRIGHMEAAVAVPADGVQCPGLTVTHTVDTPTVTPGQEFIYTITITNPNDCDLSDLKLVETPSGSPAGVKFTLVSATPPGADLSGDAATYPDIGPLAAGQTKTVKIKVKVPPDSAPGKLTALATVAGVCPPKPQPTTDLHPSLPGPGSPSPDDIPVGGSAVVDGPKVGVCVVPDVTKMTPTAAKAILEAAGCILGQVKPGPDLPGQTGKILDQGPPAGNTVPLGTPVDVTIGGPVCTVPSLAGKTPDEAKALLEAAGCRLGDVTPGPDNPAQSGKIVDQGPTGGTAVPGGTQVNVTMAGQVCTVPGITGQTEPDARTKVEAAGCVLTIDSRTTGNPSEVGKVLAQSPEAATVVAKGSAVRATLGVMVAGQALERRPTETTPTGNPQPSDTAPTLVKTGGVALGGLALWLLVSGLLTQLAGSERLWRLARRRKG